jgi:hypothetical protein
LNGLVHPAPEPPEPEPAFAGIFGLMILVAGGLIAAALAWFGARNKSKAMVIGALITQFGAVAVSFPLLRAGFVWAKYWLGR